jgi:DNA invertase Pin-like site-specific DNA recombinase
MLRAAVYARRSTDEHQAASLEVQVEEARQYIERKGWSVEERRVYLEDAVARAEFKRRPSLIRMLNDATQRAFDVIVTRDETRLGDDMIRTTMLIGDILDHDVQLFYYFSGEKVVLDDATARFMVAARNFASELEREKISTRTREHLMVKARRRRR